MSVRDDFTYAVRNFYLDPDAFAESVVYFPTGSDSVSILAVIERDEEMAPSDLGDGERRMRLAKIFVATEDVPSPIRGEVIQFDGRDWKIDGAPERNTDGSTWLDLIHATDGYERSGSGHRRKLR